MKQQKGFTLIELIIVIIILGILAVTAAPRFFNFASDARVSVLQGLEGSIKGANQMVYGRASIAGATTGESTVTVTTGVDVGTFNGYVKAEDLEDILDAADFSFVEKTAGDYTVVPATPGVPAVAGVYYVISSAITLPTTGANPAENIELTECYLSYTSSVAPVTEPVIALVTDGC